MKGGLQDNENMSAKGKQRLSSGLIPITAKILADMVSPDDSGVEYKSVSVHDVLIAGTLIYVNESDTKLTVKIWDHTGIVNITFFNRNEFESLTDMKNTAEMNLGKPVKIYGTIKYYKKNATINGAKMILIKENELIQHFMEVAHSWMYLTGKLKQIEDNQQHQIEMARNINNAYNNPYTNNTYNNNNNNNYGNNSYQGSNVYQFNNHGNQFQQTGVGMRNNNNSNNNLSRDENQILNVIREISNKTPNGCLKANLVETLRSTKALNSNFEAALENLLNSGYLIDEDDVFRITGNH